MIYPTISEYIEAIKAAEDNFKELNNLRPVLGDDGLPVMTSGNFAVVFKMKEVETGKLYALKCFTKDQVGRDEAYRLITEELKGVDSPYLTSICYLDKELFVDTGQSTETEFPVLLMDWVDGNPLDKYLRENLDDKYALEMLAYRFSQLAQWLIPQPFAHGDLKPDNILVREDGSLVIVDYDGMYVPAMKGQKARELGSPDFRHPLRTEDDFNEHIDDFPIASILLSLKAISLKPILFRDFGKIDGLLFSEHNYINIADCVVLDKIYELIADEYLRKYFSTFLLILSNQRMPSSIEDYLGYFPINIEPSYDRLSSDMKICLLKAKKGDAVSQNKLGYSYYYGEGIDQNYSKAFYWYHKSAIQGLHSAQYNLGICYQEGHGVQQNYLNARDWYEKAAVQGEADAQYYLGLYYRLDKFGIGVDLAKSFKWFLLSAKQGNASAQDHIGGFYQYGKGGVEVDLIEAVKWYKLSAEEGDKYGQYHLAKCYWYGIGVNVNLKEAIRLFGLAAGQGLKKATKEVINIRGEWHARAIYSEDGNTFEGIYAGHEYEIREGTKYITEGACCDIFNEIDCSYFRKLTIPKTIISIGDYPFGSYMSEVICHSPFYEIDNKTLYTKGKKELIQCFNNEVDEFIIPEGVEVIRKFAFYSCSFKRIIIPPSVKEIGINPFVETGIWGDDGHWELEVISLSPKYIVRDNGLYEGNIIISYWGKDKVILLPKDLQVIGSHAFWYASFVTIYLPETIQSIGDGAFVWNDELENIVVPRGTLPKFKAMLPSFIQDKLFEFGEEFEPY